MYQGYLSKIQITYYLKVSIARRIACLDLLK